MTSSLEIGFELNKIVNKIKVNKNLQAAIFEQKYDFIDDTSREKLWIVFLNYLEKCVYDNSYQCADKNFREFVAKIEDYVILKFPDNAKLSKEQKTVFEKAKGQVVGRLCQSINQQSDEIDKKLSDFDRIKASKEPTPSNKKDVKIALETFLKSIFLSASNLNNLPIFYKGYEKERDKTFKIALEYLCRFVYKVSRKHLFDDPFIIVLEDSIAKCNDFSLKPGDRGELCTAKSILLDRVGRRNTLDKSNPTRKLINKGN